MQGFSFEDLCALNLNNHRKADLRKSGIVQFREAIACIMTSLINTIPSTVNYSIDKDEIMLKLYTLNRKTRVKHCFKSFHLNYIFFVKWGIHVNVKIMIVMHATNMFTLKEKRILAFSLLYLVQPFSRELGVHRYYF